MANESYDVGLSANWGNTARYHDMIIRSSFVDDSYYMNIRWHNWSDHEKDVILNSLMPRNTYAVKNSGIYIQFTKLEHAFAYKQRIKDALGWNKTVSWNKVLGEEE